MKSSFEVFLLVAEELNITRAAERAFISQQCASDHIRRLEEEQGISLFTRKPRLGLTPAGQIMVKTLRKMKNAETMMKKQFQEIKDETIGKLSIGINPTRARILLPSLLKKFQLDFPKVKISFVLNDTIASEQMLLENKIDFFLGIDTQSNPAFERRQLAQESIYFIAAPDLIAYSSKFSDLRSDTIQLTDINNLPMIRNHKDSTLNELINHDVNQKNILLNTTYFISDYDTQIALCASGIAGAFCPALMIHRVIEHNQNCSDHEKLLIFRVSDLPKKLRVDLVTFSEADQPKYAKHFIELLCAEVAEKYNDINSYLEK